MLLIFNILRLCIDSLLCLSYFGDSQDINDDISVMIAEKRKAIPRTVTCFGKTVVISAKNLELSVMESCVLLSALKDLMGSKAMLK